MPTPTHGAELTDGKAQNGQQLIARYNSMGYEVKCISDYHQINPQQNTADPLFVPIYEHGYNLFKAHRLPMGSTNISYYDVSLLHQLDDRQAIIRRLKNTSPYVAIAHPEFGKGHPLSDFPHLTGYDCMEVLNHYRRSDKQWDAALSAGRPVWIIANDDMHDLNKPKEVGVRWTMVAANQPIPPMSCAI